MQIVQINKYKIKWKNSDKAKDSPSVQLAQNSLHYWLILTPILQEMDPSHKYRVYETTVTVKLYMCFVHSPCRALGLHSSTNLCGPFYVSTAPSKDKRCGPGEPLDKTLPGSLHRARTQSLGVKYSLQCFFTLTHTHTPPTHYMNIFLFILPCLSSPLFQRASSHIPPPILFLTTSHPPISI